MEIAALFSFIFLLALVFTAALYRLSAIKWSVLIGAGLLTVTYLNYLPIRGIIFCWLCYLAAVSFANMHGLRQRMITGPLLKRIKEQLPAISETEREAINAGNTWWEKELFCGQPDWQQLLKMPAPQLTEAEQHFIANQVEQLCQMLNDWKIVYEDSDLPPTVWEYIKKEKFFGLIISKEYGGLEFSALAHSTIISKIATRSVSAAVNIMVPNSLGPAELLTRYGTSEQKNYYLPRLAKGEEIPCFALTAPTAGSDASNIPDTGIVCKGEFNGRTVTGIRLNWDKRYITLAPIATVLGLAFHMYDPDHLLGDKDDIGITLCLIPTSHPGVETGTRHIPLQMAFMNGPTRGKDVFIPLDWIIGGAEQAGSGWRMLMECLSIGRSISLPALATASSKVAYRFTGAYARLRRQFNTPISSFEGIEEALGTIAGYTYLLEAARIMTAGAIDEGINPAVASAIAKYHMTEMGRISVSHAMDIHAGHMIQVGPRNFLANLHFCMPISITVEGANILTRNLIIFGQGAIRCHPYLLKEIELMTAPKTDMTALDKTLMSHIGFYISNFIRTVGYSLTGGRLIFTTSKNARIKKYERQLTRMSAALALTADTCLIMLGGSLKRRERISARLGDILSQLYLASAALKYFHDHPQSEDSVNYASWSLQQCLYEIQIAFDELFNNIPKRWLGYILKWSIFPFGQAYLRPRDKLHKRLVTPMIEATPLRNQVTQHCFISADKSELTNKLELALGRAEANDLLRKKLQQAVKSGTIPEYYPFLDRLRAAEEAGILTSSEADAVREFEALREEIIKVNEFTFDLERVIA
jgi:alkylation response protein AidB-like acyl-CoA dehydrogenase